MGNNCPVDGVDGGIPDLYHPVNTSPHEARAISAERHAVDGSYIRPQGELLLAGGCVPDLDLSEVIPSSIFAAARDDALAVRTERQAPDSHRKPLQRE